MRKPMRDEGGAMLSGEQIVRAGAQRSAVPATGLGTITLVPDSSIQFIDFTLSALAAGGIAHRYLEDMRGGEPALYPIELDDGVPYHPVTGAIADVSRTFGVSGAQALEPFLDTWLPIPYLRVRRIATGLGYVLDEGPSNWARVFISHAPAPTQDADGDAGKDEAAAAYQVVLAFDTRCSARTPAAGLYAAPSLEDARSGKLFRFSADLTDVGWFVSEAWVDDWISERADGARANPKVSRDSQDGWQPQLGYLACYLSLLTVLETLGLPDIRFAAPQGERDSIPVDLVVDLGNSRSIAMLSLPHAAGLAKAGGRIAAEPMAVRPLPLRDLTEPWRIHDGAFPSRVEFAPASFGREALSRLSGRSNAFFWPSVARIGREAERLAAARPTTDDATGLTSPLRYLWDNQPSEAAWRFVKSAGHATQRGTMVCGAPLVYVTEDGTVVDAGGHAPAPVKPRFSRASFATFLVAELLVHAISAINAPNHRGSGAQSSLPRRLGRILLTVPAGLLEHERNALRARVRDAVRLVWQTPGWLDGQTASNVPWPEVSFVEDNATNAIIAYLHNEIVDKFRGRSETYFELAGRWRPDHRTGGAMRIACLDIGGGSAGLTIATMSVSAVATVQGTIDFSDCTRVGGDDVAKAIAERHVLPALEQALAQCRLANAHAFLTDILGGRSKGRPSWLGGFGRRFARDLAYPLALALIKFHAEEHELAGDIASRRTIGALLSRAGVASRVIADELDDLAADEGAVGFSCQAAPITFLKDEMTATILGVLRPLLVNAADLIEAMDCDAVLLSGAVGQLPTVLDALIEAMPSRAGHVVQLSNHRIAGWYTPRTGNGRVGDSKPLAAIGALIAAGATGGPLGGIRIARDAGAPLAVGPMTKNGTVPESSVLFRLDNGRGQHGTSHGGQDTLRGSAPASNGPVMLTCEPGFALGLRRTALETWPATPLYVLRVDPAMAKARLRPPLRITVERTQAGTMDEDQLTLIRAMDVEGANLSEKDVTLRCQTLLDPANADKGYWLDCGGLAVGGGGHA